MKITNAGNNLRLLLVLLLTDLLPSEVRFGNAYTGSFNAQLVMVVIVVMIVIIIL